MIVNLHRSGVELASLGSRLAPVSSNLLPTGVNLAPERCSHCVTARCYLLLEYGKGWSYFYSILTFETTFFLLGMASIIQKFLFISYLNRIPSEGMQLYNFKIVWGLACDIFGKLSYVNPRPVPVLPRGPAPLQPQPGPAWM